MFWWKKALIAVRVSNCSFLHLEKWQLQIHSEPKFGAYQLTQKNGSCFLRFLKNKTSIYHVFWTEKRQTPSLRSQKSRRWVKLLFWPPPSRRLIVNNDHTLMFSSLISKMHQFYNEYRKNWWFLDDTSMFNPCLQCFSTLKPTMFRWIDINDFSIWT